MSIDPLRLAQFMVLPGAAELVDAFSAIPPGPIRDSVVHHARVLAEAAGWAGPDFAGLRPETVRVLEPARLASPFAKGLSAASAEGQIVERALRGEAPHAIADDMGVKLGVVIRVMGKARREGGLVFPGDEAASTAKAKAKAKSKASRKGIKLHTFPVPPGPWWWEDPAHPVWDNPGLLPHLVTSATGSMAGIGPHDSRSHATMRLAAERRGLTLRQYIAQRLDIVRRVQAGESPVEVANDLRIQAQEVYGILTKVGLGRMAALNARTQEAEPPAPEPEPQPDPEPVQAARGVPANRRAAAEAARQIAAAKWGFGDVGAYDHARDRVRQLRLLGVAPLVIAQRIGQPHTFVRAAITFWREAGVEWPAIRDVDRLETAAA